MCIPTTPSCRNTRVTSSRATSRFSATPWSRAAWARRRATSSTLRAGCRCSVTRRTSSPPCARPRWAGFSCSACRTSAGRARPWSGWWMRSGRARGTCPRRNSGASAPAPCLSPGSTNGSSPPRSNWWPTWRWPTLGPRRWSPRRPPGGAWRTTAAWSRAERLYPGRSPWGRPSRSAGLNSRSTRFRRRPGTGSWWALTARRMRMTGTSGSIRPRPGW